MRRSPIIAVTLVFSLLYGIANAAGQVLTPNAWGPGRVGHAGNQVRPLVPVRPAVPAVARAVRTAAQPAAVPAAVGRRHPNHGHWRWAQNINYNVFPIPFGYWWGARLSRGGYANDLDNVERYNLAASQAALNWQMALQLAVQNQLEAAKARDEARQAWAAERRAREAERRANDRRKAQENPPPPAMVAVQLSPQQFDPATGKIAWPEVLQRTAFADVRSRLEQFAANRTVSQDTIQSRSRQANELIEEMKSQLREQVQEMPSMKYVAARRFLAALAGELQSAGVKGDLVAERSGLGLPDQSAAVPPSAYRARISSASSAESPSGAT